MRLRLCPERRSFADDIPGLAHGRLRSCEQAGAITASTRKVTDVPRFNVFDIR